MLPWLTGSDGRVAADPGRVHTEGRMARVAVEEAREQVAHLFGARSREVVFTSGATESINAVAFGARGRPAVCAAVEHSAVREASARWASSVVVPDVDSFGRISIESVSGFLDGEERPGIVHCQWANHEVGTLQPVPAVVEAAREGGVLVHLDAAAAAGHDPIAFDALGADLLSISAHKLGGPQGIGALLVRRGLRLDPFLLGGDQERARRAGLEHVVGIVGFGAACAALATDGLVVEEAVASGERTARLRDGALAHPGIFSYGDPDHAGRLPNLVCLGVEGVEAEPVLLGLDQAGIAAHSGSSCSSEALEPSPVLQAMGVDADRSLRLSVGWSSTDEDIDAFLKAFPEVVTRLRALRSSP